MDPNDLVTKVLLKFYGKSACSCDCWQTTSKVLKLGIIGNRCTACSLSLLTIRCCKTWRPYFCVCCWCAWWDCAYVCYAEDNKSIEILVRFHTRTRDGATGGDGGHTTSHTWRTDTYCPSSCCWRSLARADVAGLFSMDPCRSKRHRWILKAIRSVESVRQGCVYLFATEIHISSLRAKFVRVIFEFWGSIVVILFIFTNE